MIKFLFSISICIILFSGCRTVSIFDVLTASQLRHLTSAEKLTEEAKYPEAILEYEKHMEDRLQDEKRPDWENPYFYLLRIGDLQLKLEKPDLALTTYLQAEQKGVEIELVSDRIRSVATWYEARGDLKGAISVLEAHRNKDQFLFDSALNRLNRRLTEIEEVGQ